MKRRRFIRFTLLSPIVLSIGCKASHVRRTISAGRHLAHGSVGGAAVAAVPGTGVAGVDSFVREQLSRMVEKLAQEWGDEKVPSNKEYVKYTDDYRTRAIVNFQSGNIRVETLESENRREKLKTAIVHTLLTPQDPRQVDLLSDEQVEIGEKPFLYNLVLDQDNKPVRWEWRAKRYARYLLRNSSQQDTYNDRRRFFVQFEMVKDHAREQQRQYKEHVHNSAQRFRIDPSLIYAIIEVESSFNPYAISHVPAYGLMQIVPQTAGRDAYQLIYNRKGTPSREYLFQPANNIQMGTAYLHILSSKYLDEIHNPQTKEYCVIAGYNTGSGNVLRTFDSDRDKAFSRINSMSSQQVYKYLVRNLPYSETRDYLPKVTRAKHNYA